MQVCTETNAQPYIVYVFPAEPRHSDEVGNSKDKHGCKHCHQCCRSDSYSFDSTDSDDDVDADVDMDVDSLGWGHQEGFAQSLSDSLLNDPASTYPPAAPAAVPFPVSCPFSPIPAVPAPPPVRPAFPGKSSIEAKEARMKQLRNESKDLFLLATIQRIMQRSVETEMRLYRKNRVQFLEAATKRRLEKKKMEQASIATTGRHLALTWDYETCSWQNIW